MLNVETIKLLKEASGIIKYLRQQNQIMQARLNMFDDMMLLLKTQSPYGNSMATGPDIAYQLDIAIKEAEDAAKKSPSDGSNLTGCLREAPKY